jgi:hypothetical protein
MQLRFGNRQSESRVFFLKNADKLSHACNPNYLGGKDGEDYDLKQIQQNSARPPSQPMIGCGGLMV